MMRGTVTGALLLLTYTSALAQGIGTTQDLYDRCARNEPICGAYLMGVASVLIMMGKAYQDPKLQPDFMAPFQVWAICPARGPVNGDFLRQRFMVWTEKNPAERTELMGATAMHAFQETWPCADRSN